MRTTPIGHKYDPHHPDLEGRQVVLAADFEICKKQGYDILTDYEKERSLRLAAERQVGELREKLAEAWKRGDFWIGAHSTVCKELSRLEAKLDTAMGLLRDVREHPSVLEFACVPYGWIDKRNTFLNTTSTEGKDEYCGDHCTAFDQIEDFTEGKDHE